MSGNAPAVRTPTQPPNHPSTHKQAQASKHARTSKQANKSPPPQNTGSTRCIASRTHGSLYSATLLLAPRSSLMYMLLACLFACLLACLFACLLAQDWEGYRVVDASLPEPYETGV